MYAKVRSASAASGRVRKSAPNSSQKKHCWCIIQPTTASVAEWSIARGCRPRGLVPTGVRIPPGALGTVGAQGMSLGSYCFCAGVSRAVRDGTCYNFLHDEYSTRGDLYCHDDLGCRRVFADYCACRLWLPRQDSTGGMHRKKRRDGVYLLLAWYACQQYRPTSNISIHYIHGSSFFLGRFTLPNVARQHTSGRNRAQHFARRIYRVALCSRRLAYSKFLYEFRHFA